MSISVMFLPVVILLRFVHRILLRYYRLFVRSVSRNFPLAGRMFEYSFVHLLKRLNAAIDHLLNTLLILTDLKRSRLTHERAFVQTRRFAYLLFLAARVVLRTRSRSFCCRDDRDAQRGLLCRPAASSASSSCGMIYAWTFPPHWHANVCAANIPVDR